VNRADLRESFLSLTAAGRAIYEDLAPDALAFATRLVEAVGPADQAAFDRALDRLTERSAALVAETVHKPVARRDPTARGAPAHSNQEEDA